MCQSPTSIFSDFTSVARNLPKWKLVNTTDKVPESQFLGIYQLTAGTGHQCFFKAPMMIPTYSQG